jgi:succinylglutamate desuccinylase
LRAYPESFGVEGVAPVSIHDRVLGRVRGERPGPTLIVVGGIHGNEPAGVQALGRVLARLGARSRDMRGDFVALAGNRAALEVGRRFIHMDLNRAWTDDRLERLRATGDVEGLAEDQEQLELLEQMEAVVRRARGPVFVLDLHTTSGVGGPFTTFGDTLPNRDFASHIPVPMILGLEELVEGTLLAFLSRNGIVGAVYETGQHVEGAAVDRAEAGVWIALQAAGVFAEGRLPEATVGRKLLQREANGIPRVLEMRYRHDIRPEDGFCMEPGYKNFEPVVQGQVVARDVRGDVRVGETGRLLMPLYQEQGQDGFFLIREFRPFWLFVSQVLRRMRVDRVAHWLPGVQRDPSLPDAVVVNKGVARWYALQLFHLLGYRRHEDAGPRLVLGRRRYDEARYVEHGQPPGTLT